MSIDFTKPVQTVDGRKVRILCTDRVDNLYPIVGLVIDRGIESTHCWTRTGRDTFGEHDSPWDLINVPPRKKKVRVEVRLYRDHRGVYAAADLNDPIQAPAWNDDFIAHQIFEMEYEEQ